jgi:hypothetical protein
VPYGQDVSVSPRVHTWVPGPPSIVSVPAPPSAEVVTAKGVDRVVAATTMQVVTKLGPAQSVVASTSADHHMRSSERPDIRDCELVGLIGSDEGDCGASVETRVFPACDAVVSEAEGFAGVHVDEERHIRRSAEQVGFGAAADEIVVRVEVRLVAALAAFHDVISRPTCGRFVNGRV